MLLCHFYKLLYLVKFKKTKLEKKIKNLTDPGNAPNKICYSVLETLKKGM